MKPMKFHGAIEAEKAEGWLKHIEKKLDSMQAPHEYCVKFTTQMLENEASNLWDTVETMLLDLHNKLHIEETKEDLVGDLKVRNKEGMEDECLP
ncbi:hypothetical protein ACE6H2_016256 [Prunus campanulata]